MPRPAYAGQHTAGGPAGRPGRARRSRRRRRSPRIPERSHERRHGAPDPDRLPRRSRLRPPRAARRATRRRTRPGAPSGFRPWPASTSAAARTWTSRTSTPSATRPSPASTATCTPRRCSSPWTATCACPWRCADAADLDEEPDPGAFVAVVVPHGEALILRPNVWHNGGWPLDPGRGVRYLMLLSVLPARARPPGVRGLRQQAPGGGGDLPARAVPAVPLAPLNAR